MSSPSSTAKTCSTVSTTTAPASIQTQASLLNLKSQLTITHNAFLQNRNKAKGILDKAQLDLKTIPVLSRINAERARLAVEDAQARYNELLREEKLVETSLNSQIRGAEIDLQQSNIELRRAEANVAKMIIKSPIDGLTVMSTIPRGGELEPGAGRRPGLARHDVHVHRRPPLDGHQR